MYHSNPAADRARNADLFPTEVLRLYRREREIAIIVYSRGLATAKDVETALSDPIRNASVRSMLQRLVRKGILTGAKCGRRGMFLYAPALTPDSARETALKQFARDFYAGELGSLAKAMTELSAGAGIKP